MNRTFASLALAFCFLATPAHSWSLKEALHQANTTLVRVGDFCSGTIIDADKGLIATAAHCAQDLSDPTFHMIERPNGQILNFSTPGYKPVDITVTNYDDAGNQNGEQHYTAKVLKAKFPEDVAILQSISASKLPGQVTLSNTPVSWGDKVYTVGNPLMTPTVVADGIVMKPKWTFPSENGQVDVILFSAFMAPGSSGGGLFNDRGELVGITNWSRTGGPYLASPVDNLKNLLATLDLTDYRCC